MPTMQFLLDKGYLQCHIKTGDTSDHNHQEIIHMYDIAMRISFHTGIKPSTFFVSNIEDFIDRHRYKTDWKYDLIGVFSLDDNNRSVFNIFYNPLFDNEVLNYKLSI